MNMGYNNYMYSGVMSSLLVTVTKILVIILALVFIIGVITWLKDYLSKNSNTKFLGDINSDPVLKSVAVITGAVIGLVIIFALLSSLFSPGYGMNMGYGGYNMGFNNGYNMGYSPSFSITGVLYLLIKVLTFVFIISLILAAILYIKGQYESGKLNFFSGNTNRQNDNNTDNTNV